MYRLDIPFRNCGLETGERYFPTGGREPRYSRAGFEEVEEVC